jgi:hypothetical protein
VLVDELFDINIGDAVDVAEAEVFVVKQPIAQSEDTSPGVGGLAGLDEVKVPIVVLADRRLHRTIPRLDMQATSAQEAVVEAELPYDIPLLPERHDEGLDPVGCVSLHNVPQNWHPPMSIMIFARSRFL